MPITALVMGPAIAIQNSVLASGTSVSICETPPSAKRVIAFHEKAGLCQVDFDLPFLKPPFLSWRRVFRAARSGQGRVLCGVANP